MKEFPLIVSFYTKSTPYEEEAQNLIASCKKWGLEAEIEGVESQGSWELNCAYKPFFLLKKIKEKKRPILWVDADGIFVRQPTILPEFLADLAVRLDGDLGFEHPSKVISSTIFLAANKSGEALVRAWAFFARELLLDPERKEEFWDQQALAKAIEKNKEAKVVSLPLSYSKIFDHPGDCQSVKDPVIEHYQASRRFKRFIANK